MSLSQITGHAVVLSLAICLSNGCSLMPRSVYEQPRISIPQQWEGTDVTGEAIANREQWWKRFNDPMLDELIDQVLRTNNDLAAATLKVRQAQLKSGLTDTNLTPSVGISAETSLDRDLNQAINSESHSVIGTLSYELDLWGRLARLRDAARWEAEATDADRQNTALSLIATTASAYWKIAYLNQRIASGEASIKYAEKAFELVQVKYRAGAVSRLDWVQAQQNVATQKAGLIQLFQQRTETRHALAILFDQAPQNSMPERSRLPDEPLPTLEPGLPASLLGRRPDLHAAESRLREYLANMDATRASFYPTVSLTGNLNTSSTSLVSVLQNPIASLGAGLTLPFVQWNTASLTIRVSEAQYEEAVVNFRQTLYTALREVENTLSANTRYQEERFRLEQALDWSRQAERLVEIRYRAGATGMQSWLDAQESRRSAEITTAENHLNQLTNMMKLYQALGG